MQGAARRVFPYLATMRQEWSFASPATRAQNEIDLNHFCWTAHGIAFHVGAIGIAHLDQTFGDYQSMVCFIRCAETMAIEVVGIYQADENIFDGERGQAICEGDAFRRNKDHGGHTATSSANATHHWILENQSMD
jgi:hypothetical protein